MPEIWTLDSFDNVEAQHFSNTGTSPKTGPEKLETGPKFFIQLKKVVLQAQAKFNQRDF